MLGSYGPGTLKEFWDHFLDLEEWQGHEAFADGSLPRDSRGLSKSQWKNGSGTVPISMHYDGAEFYRNCEYNVWSVSSMLAHGDDARLNL